MGKDYWILEATLLEDKNTNWILNFYFQKQHLFRAYITENLLYLLKVYISSLVNNAYLAIGASNCYTVYHSYSSVVRVYNIAYLAAPTCKVKLQNGSLTR